MKYVFDGTAIGIRNKRDADPQAIGEELERITATNEGRLVPLTVVDAARSETSPLHKHFDWDDAVAAQSWRVVQARHLIGAIRIVADDPDQSNAQRAYLSITAEGRAYRRVSEILSNRQLQLVVLEAAEKELAAFERRYRDLVDICHLVRKARDQISERRRRHAAGPEMQADA